jgi:hypothetical protein
MGRRKNTAQHGSDPYSLLPMARRAHRRVLSIQFSSTIAGLNIDYVSSAAYLSPRGELTQVDYGLM